MTRSPWSAIVATFLFALPANTAAPRPHVDRQGDPLPTDAVARLGSTRFRSGEPILALAASPDGRLLASGGRGSVSLWDVATGQMVFPLTTPDEVGPFYSVRFSTDGRRLLAGSSWGHVCVWDVRTGKALHAFRVLRDCEGVKYDWSAAGRRVAAVVPGHCAEVWAIDRECRLLNLGEPPAPRTLPPRPAPLAPQAQALAPPPPPLPAPMAPNAPLPPVGQKPDLPAIALSPDGKHLACVRAVTLNDSSTYDVQILEVATGKVSKGRERMVVEEPQRMRYSSDGKQLLLLPVGRSPYLLLVFDSKTGKRSGRMVMENESIWDGAQVAYSPDGKRAAIFPHDFFASKCCVWDLETGKPICSLRDQFAERGSTVAFSADGKTLYSAGERGVILVWDASTGKQKQSLTGATAGVVALCWTPDNKGVITADRSRIVRHWDARSGRLLHQKGPLDGDVISLQLSRDRLLVCLADRPGRHPSGGNTRGLLLDWPSGKSVKLPKGLLEEGTPWLSPDGQRLVRWRGANLEVFDTESGKLLKRLPLTSSIRDGQFSPDGRYFAFVGDHHVTLWDLEGRGTEFSVLGDLMGGFSPDGRSVLIRRSVGCWILTETSTGQCREVRPAQPPRYIYSWHGFAGWRVMEYWWDSHTSHLSLRDGTECPHSLPGKYELDGSVSSPDGRLLATARLDGNVVIWDLARLLTPAKCPVTPCAHPLRDRNPPESIGFDFSVSEDRTKRPARPADTIEESARIVADPSSSAESAFAAIQKLAAAPDRAVPLIRRFLLPPMPVDERRLQQLVADLDSEDYDQRRRAEAELSRLRPATDESLRQALDSNPSLQLRRTIARLLKAPPFESIASSRLLEALERCGSPQARALLNQYARVNTAEWFRREVRSALARDVVIPPKPPAASAPEVVSSGGTEFVTLICHTSLPVLERFGLSARGQLALFAFRMVLNGVHTTRRVPNVPAPPTIDPVAPAPVVAPF
jgi:WD40 repeat protein